MVSVSTRINLVRLDGAYRGCFYYISLIVLNRMGACVRLAHVRAGAVLMLAFKISGCVAYPDGTIAIHPPLPAVYVAPAPPIYVGRPVYVAPYPRSWHHSPYRRRY
jgi:hypothetical protein